jgi:hypothetical protein
MLSLKSKTANLQYDFITTVGSGHNTRTLGVHGHPLFTTIEAKLTEVSPQFDVELRSYEFDDQIARKILNDILATNIQTAEITETPPQATANFPFENIRASLGKSVTDDRTQPIWVSTLKLAHIASKGAFQFVNDGE